MNILLNLLHSKFIIGTLALCLRKGNFKCFFLLSPVHDIVSLFVILSVSSKFSNNSNNNMQGKWNIKWYLKVLRHYSMHPLDAFVTQESQQ